MVGNPTATMKRRDKLPRETGGVDGAASAAAFALALTSATLSDDRRC